RNPIQPVNRPMRAGGEHDDVGAVVENLVGGQSRARDYLDVAQFVDLNLAVVGYATPLSESGKLRDPPHDAADLGLRVDQVNSPHSSTPEDHCTLHPRRPGAENQDIGVGILRPREPLWVPTPAVLLAHSRVLRARDVRVLRGTRRAEVASDA